MVYAKRKRKPGGGPKRPKRYRKRRRVFRKPKSTFRVSYTKTRTKRKLKLRGPLGGADSCRTAGGTIVQRKIRPHGKPSGRTLMYRAYNYAWSSPAGVSTWHSVNSVAAKTELESFESTLPIDVVQVGANPAVSQEDRKFYLKYTNCMFDFRNACNQQVDIELFMWHPIRDIDFADANGTPFKAMQRGLVLTGGNDPVIARRNPGGNIDNVTLYKLPLNAYGNYLKQNYKLAKYAKICLGPYEQQSVNIKVIHNKSMTRAFLQNSDFFKYLTVMPFVRISAPISPTEGPGTNPQPNWSKVFCYHVMNTFGYRLMSSVNQTRIIAPPGPVGVDPGIYPGAAPNNVGNVDLGEVGGNLI